jgi:twitching motility protein PilT
MVEVQASDLHLVAGSAPVLRIHGILHPVEGYEVLDGAGVEALVLPALTDRERRRLRKMRDFEMPWSIPGLSRFRAALMFQRGTLGAAFRAIPPRPLTIDELGLPEVVRQLSMRPRGLVIVAGATGSGKSTTMAAMVDHINATQPVHIVTIEDPIEFIHRNKRAVIRQRELGADAVSFSRALKHVLRQDPDVIMVGEMRDLRTIRLALTAAETGHLVLATLHTRSAAATVDRIIDVFPAAQQAQIRAQVANVIEGVICQTLIPRSDGTGRICALELMLASNAVRSLIRENKSHQLPSAIDSAARAGMQSLNQALMHLVAQGQISIEEATSRSSAPDELAKMLLRVHKY